MQSVKVTLAIIFSILIVIIVLGLYQSLSINIENIDSTYLLTVISAVGALGGITVALYGFFLTFQLPKIVQKELDLKMKQYDELQFKREEATQKMMVAYGISDPDKKIELLHKVIQLNPKTYNVFVTMAYTYWYDKKDKDAALEYFLKDLEYHPDNYQSMCDLIALHTELEEWNSATLWLKKALKVNPDIIQDIENDSRLSALRNSVQYQKIIRKLNK